MRLIDADELIDKAIEDYCKECGKRKGVKDGKWRVLYKIGEAPCRACDVNDMVDRIDNAPTVEAEPITLEKAIDYLHSIGWMQEHDRILTEPKHGRWVKLYKTALHKSDGDYVRYMCSTCGRFLDIPYYGELPVNVYYPYCHCGAKMDEADNG